MNGYLESFGLSEAEADRVEEVLDVICVLVDQLPDRSRSVALVALAVAEILEREPPLKAWASFKRLTDIALRATLKQRDGVPAGVVPS